MLGALKQYRSHKGILLKDLAPLCGVSEVHLSRLENGRRRVTAEIAVVIEQATGGEVSRSQLRPDLWPEPAEAAE